MLNVCISLVTLLSLSATEMVVLVPPPEMVMVRSVPDVLLPRFWISLVLLRSPSAET